MKKYFFVLAILAFFAVSEASAQKIADFSWMTGCWKLTMKDTAVEECWTLPGGGAMQGSGRTYKADATLSREFMVIEEKAGAVTFYATIFNTQKGDKPTPFKLVKWENGEYVFENAANDYPQRIVYKNEGNGAMHAWIEMLDGKKRMDFKYMRIGAPPKPGYNEELAKKLGADERGMKQYFFVTLKRKAHNYTPEERAKLIEGHMTNIGKLAEQKVLVLAGPFFDDKDIRGIFIFDVKTMEEVQKLVETDPAVKGGVFDVEIRPWYASAALSGLGDIHNSINKTLHNK